MAKVISYSVNVPTPASALEKAIMMIDPSIAHRVCGFRIVKGSRNDKSGMTVSFFIEKPEDLELISKSWDFDTVSFEGQYVLNIFLRFKSNHFLNEAPDINGFMLEWSAALTKWVSVQSVNVYQALLFHPVRSVECLIDEEGEVKMRVKLALKEKIHPTLWNLQIVS
ncbi:MAG: hypothetical protein M0P64_02135 [Candidatus Pacebacteria bacterium]|nr:hypothetical protein [Candidatus Paceibacterota bacterium]